MNYRELTIEELERLISEKDGRAMCELGRRYRFGEFGVERNYTIAYRMYHKAEKLNMNEAFFALAQMYENGEYFARNQQLAQEYYTKAGALDNTDSNIQSMQSSKHTAISSSKLYKDVNTQTATTSAVFITKTDIEQTLKQAENIRAKGDTINAKLYVQQAADELNLGRNTLSIMEIAELEANINWLYAYIAFNEQKYADFEKYVFQNNVMEYFPWSTYLVTVVHRILNADDAILLHDAQNMINALNNSRLNTMQLSDLLSLLGDLCLLGISNAEMNPIEQAYEFYQNAANEGNQYASEQLAKFSKNIFGKLVYKE